MAGSRWYSAGACDFVAQPAAAITIKPPLGNLLPLRLLNVSDPTSNKASTAALSVVGYVVWPSLGLQQSCPAPTKASVAKPATKKPVAKESAAKPAPVKESKLTAKLTEIAGQESKITAIKISGPTAEVTVSRKEGETRSQLVQQGEQWLVVFSIDKLFSGLVDEDLGFGSGNSIYSDQTEALMKKVEVEPKDEASWAALTKAQVQQASIIGYDQTTQTFTAAGKAELEKGSSSWQAYLALNPEKPDDRVASLMVNAYGPGGLNEPAKSAAALKVVIESRGPSAALYSQLAVLTYLAGNKRESNVAEQRALELTPANKRKLVAAQLATQRTQIDSAKAQAAQQ